MSAAALQLHAPRLLMPELDIDHWYFIDHESYWDDDYTLSKMTNADYARDPRFETIGVGVFDGEDSVWMERDEYVAWARTVPWEKTAVVSHHRQFDGLIDAYHYGIHPAFQCCTMSMARSYGIEGGVSLANLGVRFGIGEKGHEVEKTKGKRRRDFTREEWLRFGDYCMQDNNLAKGIFDAMLDGYNGEIPFPEGELWTVDATIRCFTEPKLFVDEPLLTQYIAEEKERKRGLLERIERDRTIVMSGDRLAHEFMLLGVDPPTKLSPKQKNPDGSPKAIWAFAKNDPGMQELLEHESDEVRYLAEARVALKSTINETRAERLLRLGKNLDGSLRPCPVYYLWYGAHTGRHSGGDKMNFQNFERTNRKNPRKGALRKALLAPLGHKVCAADSGQIEARITAWLAGHEQLVEAFRQKRDVYSEVASEIYGRTIDRKKNAEDEIPGQVGKVSVLGFGYGQGWETAAQNFIKGVQGAPPIIFTEHDAEVIGVDPTKFRASDSKMDKVRKMVSRLDFESLVTHCAVTDKIVRKWRDMNEPITDLWHEMEDVLEVITQDSEESFTFGPGDCLRTARHAIVLPNGMKLRYPGLKYQDDDSLGGYEGYSYLGRYGKIRKRLYGGALVENIVQALARIVVFDQMNHARAVTGYSPVMVTHDEIALVVPDAEAPRIQHVLQETMKTPPAWCADLPLSVEGGYSHSYGACK